MDHAIGAMKRSKRSAMAIAASLEAARIATTLGQELRRIRSERRWTQQRLAAHVGLSPVRIGELERGDGATAPLATWILIGQAIGRPVAVGFSAPIDAHARLADAGHLEMQEAVLSMAARHGWHGSFELRTRQADSSRSVDVLVRDDTGRQLLVIECWNRFGDVGAAARSTDRKTLEAADFGVAIGGSRPYSVHACWVVRPTAANRELVRRYPGVLRARFRGSSVGWCRTLNGGTPPPADPGLVWLEPTAQRAVAIRLRPWVNYT